MLTKRAVVSPKGTSWITKDSRLEHHQNADQARNISLAGPDLYHGVPGIVLFLGYLGQHDENYTDFARKGLSVMVDAATADRVVDLPVGPYLGRTAYHFVLHHLAVLWDEPGLLDKALADLPSLEALIAEDPAS